MNDPARRPLEILSHDAEGIRSLVSFGDWLVAMLNWEPRFDLANVGQIERHNETDEVFVLLKGHGILFTVTEACIEVYDLRPGQVYNVTQGTWHSAICGADSKWLIIEANTTSVHNSDSRPLSPRERESLEAKYPAWLREG